MPEDSSKSLRDTLLIPIVVGIVIAIATYFLPRLFEKGKVLSYTVDGPITYISQQLQGVVVTVNGTPVPTLLITRVRIWNSGKDPLINLGVLVLFPSAHKDFKILSVAHDTQPGHEFGSITEDSPDFESKRFTFQLLNANDADTITLLTNDSVRPSVYSKAEGLRVKSVAREETVSRAGTTGWATLAASAVGTFASLLGILFYRVTARRELDRREMRLEELREREQIMLRQRQAELDEMLSERQADLAQRRAALEAELGQRQAELDRILSARESDLAGRRAALEAELGQRQAELDRILSARENDLAGRRAALEAEFEQRQDELLAMKADLEARLRASGRGQGKA